MAVAAILCLYTPYPSNWEHLVLCSALHTSDKSRGGLLHLHNMTRVHVIALVLAVFIASTYIQPGVEARTLQQKTEPKQPTEPKLPVFREEESSKSDDASDDATADSSPEGGDDADNDRRLLTSDARGTSNSTKPQAPSAVVAKAKPVVVSKDAKASVIEAKGVNGRKLLQQATNGKQEEEEDEAIDEDDGRKLMQEEEDDDDEDGRKLLQQGEEDDAEDDDEDGRKLL